MSAPDRAADYLAAIPHTRAEVVLTRPNPVPKEPGVYGWWFRKLPAEIATAQCEKKDGLTLLYTGISPKKPPANGTTESRQQLRKRITTHYTGNAAGSTLRLTLGCLLADSLGIELRRFGSGERLHFGLGEKTLSQWMHTNALVSWITSPQPWLVEDELIAHLDVPLNLQGNNHNHYHPKLTGIRQAAKARALSLPALPNPGAGGKYTP